MSKKAKSMIPMTEEEKNALHQIARFDSRITDDNTVVRLDKTVRNKDGSKVKKYVIAQGEKVKYKADFIEDSRRQKLVQIVSIKRVEKLPERKAAAPKRKPAKSPVVSG